MKEFEQVEAGRRAYHADATLNSVHRSSLLVPRLAGASVDISFLNHFLLKRGYGRVACRVTEVDGAGRRIQARLVPIDEPRVYTLTLSDDAHDETTDFIVEFFGADNLFIPFPAVMVNHRGPNFLNMVHSYNRVLNDVFEDDNINTKVQLEAAIDVRLEHDVSTMLVMQAGQQPCRGVVDLRLKREGADEQKTIALDLPRFGHREIQLGSLFGGVGAARGGILTVQQPHQPMFFGRLLVGQRSADGAIAANHSYYDSSDTAEYWDDDRPSVRLYPHIAELETLLRVYPIQSPSRLKFEIGAFGVDGTRLGDHQVGELSSPGDRYLDVSISDLLRGRGSKDIAAFAVIARPLGGMTPTRINHQLVYRDGGLESSINMSLTNPNIFAPPGKRGYAWGQWPIGPAIDSWLGVTTNSPDGEACAVEFSLYDQTGFLARRELSLRPGGAHVLRPSEVLTEYKALSDGEGVDYLWYTLESARADVFGYTITRHKVSRQCSGEHAF